MKQYLILLIFLAGYISSTAQSMVVEVQGSATFNNLYVISEAGADFPSNIESESNMEISVLYSSYWDKRDNPNGKWRIHINKSDINWNSNLSLLIKRSGDGYKNGSNGTANIHDGENYLPVTDSPSYFFEGKGEITNIPLQLSISGFSIIMGSQEYETSITLTVYDGW